MQTNVHTSWRRMSVCQLTAFLSNFVFPLHCHKDILNGKHLAKIKSAEANLTVKCLCRRVHCTNCTAQIGINRAVREDKMGKRLRMRRLSEEKIVYCKSIYQILPNAFITDGKEGKDKCCNNNKHSHRLRSMMVVSGAVSGGHWKPRIETKSWTSWQVLCKAN